ncbi:MAG: site-2 protease family protein [Phycisphaerae bacterium]
MSQTKSVNILGRILLFFLVLFAVAALAVILIKLYGAFILAILGIGLIVFFHELGHFTVAKLTDIHVTAFSVGFPPVLVTIKRIADAYLIRILPGSPKEPGGEPTSLLSFKLPAKCQAGETEYRIGMIPFGGFVKMLGQDDTKVEITTDPRAYSNKPVGVRMAVIVAGVLFNVLFASAIFIAVFLKGVSLVPPVIGEVMPNSPAYHAGIEPGDEFIMINGRSSNLQFRNIFEAAALSRKGKSIPVTVKKRDGSIVDLELVAEHLLSDGLRSFGVGFASSLTVARLSVFSESFLTETTNLKSGDRIVAVNNRDVNDYFDLADELNNIYKPSVTILAERTSSDAMEKKLVEAQIALEYSSGPVDPNRDSELYHIYSIVPVLTVISVSEIITYADGGGILMPGDVITRTDDVNYPTYAELREVTNRFAGEKLEIQVLRTDPHGEDNEYIVQVIPRKEGSRTVIGMAVGLDLNRPVVAKAIENGNFAEELNIERGSKIIAVDGKQIENFFDMIEILQNAEGAEVSIQWQSPAGVDNTATIPLGQFDEMVTIKAALAQAIPFEPLERIYKADGPLTAIAMGFRETAGYIRQAFLTLRQFAAGQVSPKNFLGPVGIVKFSYDIVTQKSLIYYIYFVGLFNAFIAVINSVPFLPFDGGHVVLLGIEKITGKPVNERVQAAMIYAGLVLVLAFAAYITFNDIMRIIRPGF